MVGLEFVRSRARSSLWPRGGLTRERDIDGINETSCILHVVAGSDIPSFTQKDPDSGLRTDTPVLAFHIASPEFCFALTRACLNRYPEGE